ncbi:MAG TPA: glycosyltransferase [Thermoanaerobaculia bacterium]|nr:glycosyltransferase [Thermoanaerobaculia bacterium]
MLVYTICTQSYLAYSEVLAATFARHNPGQRLSVVVLDGDETTRVENADVVLIDQLPFESAAELHRMQTIYDVVELATAIKPWAFRYFLDRGHETVIYLDPDIEVFASLADLEPLAREHGIVLIPHSTKPLPDDNKLPSERDLLLAGTFNLGFLGIGPGARPFLEWWSQRLRRHCINDVANGYFVDQRWIDLVPGYFDHAILKDPGYNVAYWNLPNRTVELIGDCYFVDGSPLRFFHFSGFSPNASHLLTRHQGTSPRILLSENPAVAKLCRNYARGLRRHDYARRRKIEYRFDRAANGLPIDRRMRRAYRDALMRDEAENAATSPLPDPFTQDGAHEFTRWLREPYSPRSGGLSRYLREVHNERFDLRAAFPDVESTGAERFLAWVTNGGVVDPPIPGEMMPSRKPLTLARPQIVRDEPLERGVNLYGYVFAESGTGQIGRSIVAALQAAAIPYAVVPFTETINRQQHQFTERGNGRAIYDTNLICVNADQVPVFLEKVGAHILEDHYNIGVWAWEVDDMPEWMARSAQVLDEVWGISAYTAAAVRNRVRVPVQAFPLPVVPAPAVEMPRRQLGLPEGFLFLFCFDFESVFERKNPLGVIAAFRRAFPRPGDARLCIKSVNGKLHLAELERLRTAAAGRPDIVLIDGYRSVEEQRALMNACDAYVSLHRAEGFGLTVAEAMTLGKPVIVTNYSSTTEFTTPDNSYLVSARVIPVSADTPVYPAGARWADPDVAVAAAHMRRVYEHREEAQQIAARARQDIAALHSPDARATLLRELLDQARRHGESRPSPAQERTDLTAPALGIHDGVRDSAAERRAQILLDGPNPDLPSRVPWLARPLRRLMLRIIRNFWVHQGHVDRALLDSIGNTRATAAHDLRVVADELNRRLQELNDSTSASAHELQEELKALQRRVAAVEGNESPQSIADAARRRR